ncbi:MAG: ADP-ribosylglycohydrolase family protein, partial [Planctomycetales bacterium]|nr:ADP-ribosylglycohydrolase family protein [Planctomycetales bacterium]
MHTTHLRKDHLHGLMVGVAIGDALGGVRAGLPRRVALKMSGRPPLHYSLLGGRGLYGDETQLMLLAAQALLRSRSDLRSYRRAFQKRLSWYPLGFPPGARRATRLAASRCWLMRLRIPSGIDSEDNAAATRAIFSALAMHGTGHRLSRWVEESTKFTHTHPMAIAGCQVLAQLAEYAALTSPAEFDAAQAVHQAIRNCNQPS